MPATLDHGAKLVADLEAVLGPDGLLTGLADRELYSSDLYARGATCLAVVRPPSVEALARAVAITTEADCAVCARGGGMSYVEGYVPPTSRSVILDTSRLDAIEEINAADMYITVQSGVTWKQIYEALTPLGLRLPFYGTFSGAQATVGGGLSGGASFFGAARYGGAADIVLALEVCLADGTLIHTGHSAIPGAKPVFRAYGPDLTSLFVHDNGVLGVKTRATLRLIRMPASVDYLSFGFTDAADAIGAISEIGRADVTEEAFVLDPVKTKGALAAGGLSNDLKVLARVASGAGGLLKGLRATAGIALAGRKFADGFYSLNMSIVRSNADAVKADKRTAAQIALDHNGVMLPDSIPRATRSFLFPALNGVLGWEGERWSAVNAKVAHSLAIPLDRRVREIIATSKAELDAHGVIATQMFSIAQNHVFSYEVSINWFDEWLPLHRHAPEASYLRDRTEAAPNPASRAVMAKLRQDLIDLFAEFGAASNQLGRAYPYLTLLEPATQALMLAFKQTVDPKGLMNPGALGFR